ncbi:MAG: hypothetical protein MHM6MM_003596 [Cercozoa sp. M6MM]
MADSFAGAGVQPLELNPRMTRWDRFTALGLMGLTGLCAYQWWIKDTLFRYPVIHYPNGIEFDWEEKDHWYKSLMSKNLTPKLYRQLRSVATEEAGVYGGFTLDKAIRSGVENPESSVGIYAGDEESYESFAPVFDKIIEEYHNGYTKDRKHKSSLNPKEVDPIPDPKKFEQYIVSTRMRVARNVRGLALCPGQSHHQRKELEHLAFDCFQELPKELAGHYCSLVDIDDATQQRLLKEHLLFNKDDKYLQSAGANRDWPNGRGVFHNHDKKFLCWVGEEDQLRIISMEKGADIHGVFSRLCNGVQSIENSVKKRGKEFMYVK